MAAIPNITLTGGSVLTGLTGASGDGTPSQWRVPGANPTETYISMEMFAKWNAARTARHIDYRFRAPYNVTSADTGVTSKLSEALYEVHLVLPRNVPQSVIDACCQGISDVATNASFMAQLKTTYNFT